MFIVQYLQYLENIDLSFSGILHFAVRMAPLALLIVLGNHLAVEHPSRAVDGLAWVIFVLAFLNSFSKDDVSINWRP
ncbi:MAG: hypothetical protein D6698_06505 [Gammaproteobacteria bacterium]|nr:MAG: hypothetical protein D6698_06505 [Gammaproteobacteria bacterium]